MEYLTSPNLEILAHFRSCFRIEAFHNFQHFFAAWILAVGPRTLSEIWQFSPGANNKHHDAIYHFFADAQWRWDDLGKILTLLLIKTFVPNGYVWLVVDDTLCHKKGKNVAFGAFFLDAVKSTKRHKIFSFGVNYVVLGIVVVLPWRPNRYHCLPILWRVYDKSEKTTPRKRTELASEMARLVAAWLPERKLYLVADSVYINSAVLRDRPQNLHFIGPLPAKAALNALPNKPVGKQKGRPRVKGDRLLSPKEMFAAPFPNQSVETIQSADGQSRIVSCCRLSPVLWYTGCKGEPVQVVLVKDQGNGKGSWRDTALLCTDTELDAVSVMEGYCRRWSVEVMFRDSKQYLGLEDAQVRSAGSVARTHPMAWFCYSMTMLWQSEHGHSLESPYRNRPWYAGDGENAFSEVLGRLRLSLWMSRIFGDSGAPWGESTCEKSIERVLFLLNHLATVR
jgi:DDE superfamily endonuclease